MEKHSCLIVFAWKFSKLLHTKFQVQYTCTVCVMIMQVPTDTVVTVDDEVYGKVSFHCKDIDDQVINSACLLNWGGPSVPVLA